MSDKINPSHYKHLPVEAIEIIEAAIAKAPSNKAAYLQGQVLKYVLRCWEKNGYEDLLKAKWYLDRLIDSARQSDLQSLKEHPLGEPIDPQLPDGWRWLEEGEGLRRGDRWYDDEDGTWEDRNEAVGAKYNSEAYCPTIRRNRFEVGERVVDILTGSTLVVIGSNESLPGAYVCRDAKTGKAHNISAMLLAPYIEASE